MNTALYSDLDIKYQNVYSGPYQDLRNGNIIAALKNNQVSGFGRAMVAENETKEQVAELYDICSNFYYMDFLDGGLSETSRFLLKRGHKAKPYYTQVIDLSLSEQDLHKGLRKSYANLINRGIKGVSIGNDIGILKKLHFEAAGRKTRPDTTWDIQQDMLNDKEAFLVLSDHAGALFYYNNEWCYYAVSASIKEATAHAIIWRAITFAKSLGCRYMELGEQVYDGDLKLKNISAFKAGFGGRALMRLLFIE